MICLGAAENLIFTTKVYYWGIQMIMLWFAWVLPRIWYLQQQGNSFSSSTCGCDLLECCRESDIYNNRQPPSISIVMLWFAWVLPRIWYLQQQAAFFTILYFVVICLSAAENLIFTTTKTIKLSSTYRLWFAFVL